MLTTVSMVLFLLCAVVLVLLVLIQRGRGGGLAGAFGGPGGHSAFGTKTADVFIKVTAVLGAIFFILAVVTALLMRYQQSSLWTAEEPAPAEAPAEPGTGPGESRRAGTAPPAETPAAPAETPAAPASESGGAAAPETPKTSDSGAPDAGSP
ncbi:MAG TPA: preprotein translocase subunit SecG [Phycisphaerae bacterium]|nr:preprotein translocase subunit SecG [Phycisphaerae bacterium]